MRQATRTLSPSVTQTQTEARVEPPRLVLRPQRPESSRRVHWTEDTCDNENLNKKSSKICCIYHPPTEFGESSGEEDEDSETDSEAEELAATQGHKCCSHSRPNAYERQPKPKGNDKKTH